MGDLFHPKALIVNPSVTSAAANPTHRAAGLPASCAGAGAETPPGCLTSAPPCRQRVQATIRAQVLVQRCALCEHASAAHSTSALCSALTAGRWPQQLCAGIRPQQLCAGKAYGLSSSVRLCPPVHVTAKATAATCKLARPVKAHTYARLTHTQHPTGAQAHAHARTQSSSIRRA